MNTSLITGFRRVFIKIEKCENVLLLKIMDSNGSIIDEYRVPLKNAEGFSPFKRAKLKKVYIV